MVGVFQPHTNPVHKVTIVPRGRAGGYTLMLPKKTSIMHQDQNLCSGERVVTGRAAEELVLNEISTGAANDLERATKLVHMMICEWGMSAELGPRTFGRGHEDTVFLGRDFHGVVITARKLLQLLTRKNAVLLMSAMNGLYNLLKEKREIMERLLEP